VGLDTTGDGRTDMYVRGVDRNHDGIPDVLQQGSMATVGVDTNHDGRANMIVTGPDLNHDGIPDVLQQPGRVNLATPPVKAVRKLDIIGRKLSPVPRATVGLDTNFDGHTDTYVTGIDRNRDGIPDVLQEGPMATVGVDTNHDGRPNMIVTGVDRNRDGIPDILQRQAGINVRPPIGVLTPPTTAFFNLTTPVVHHDISTPASSARNLQEVGERLAQETRLRKPTGVERFQPSFMDPLTESQKTQISDVDRPFPAALGAQDQRSADGHSTTEHPFLQRPADLGAKDQGPADRHDEAMLKVNFDSPSSPKVSSPAPSVGQTLTSSVAGSSKASSPLSQPSRGSFGRRARVAKTEATQEKEQPPATTLTADVQRLIMSSLLYHGMTETAAKLREEAALHEVSEEHFEKTQRLRKQRNAKTLEEGENREVLAMPYMLAPPGMPENKASKFREAKVGLTEAKVETNDMTNVAGEQNDRLATVLERIQKLRAAIPEPTEAEVQASIRLNERMSRLKQLKETSQKLERTEAQNRDALNTYITERGNLMEDIQTREKKTALMVDEAARLQHQLETLRKEREGSESAQAQRIRRLLVNWDAPQGPKRIAAETFAKVDSNHDGRLEWKNDELLMFTKLIFQNHHVTMPPWPEAVWMEMYRLCDLDRSHSLDVVESLKFARCCFEAALRALVG